jgi:hypothetical protein
MGMTPDSLDSRIMDFVKEANPSGAYIVGFNDYAGRLFVASQKNIESALAKVRRLKSEAKTPLQKKLLASLEAGLSFDEPQPVLDDVVGAIFAHLAKEGVDDAHMLSLLREASRTVDASKERYSGRKIPVAVKALTLYRLGGVKEILRAVKRQTRDARIKEACDALGARVTRYVKLFELEGWGKGEFSNAERVFRTQGFDLGRQKFYPEALRHGFDYDESPDQLERKAMDWIQEEMPEFRAVTRRLAEHFGCDATPEEVEAKINARIHLDPRKLIKVTSEARRVIKSLVSEELSGIDPRYTTKAIETPPYLTGTIPTGAAQFFDTYTSRPFQYYFQTTDPKRDPDKSVAALIALLVHEEYGHCVHHSNSALGFVGKVSVLQLLPITLLGGPITEGLSFNRELEFLDVSKSLKGKRRLTRAERNYVGFLGKYGGLEQVNAELDFMTKRMRIIRFLRVVGDVRVNTGRQGLLEFLDWAHRETGIPRSSMYFQLFPAHEGIFPGYATNYAVVGQEIRAIEKTIRDPKKRVKFSTYLCSVGFPPRSMYVKMLKEYAARLK